MHILNHSPSIMQQIVAWKVGWFTFNMPVVIHPLSHTNALSILLLWYLCWKYVSGVLTIWIQFHNEWGVVYSLNSDVDKRLLALLLESRSRLAESCSKEINTLATVWNNTVVQNIGKHSLQSYNLVITQWQTNTWSA